MFKSFSFFPRAALCAGTYFVIFLLITYLDKRRLPMGIEWWMPIAGSLAGGLLIAWFDRSSAAWKKKKLTSNKKSSADNTE